MCSSKTDMTKQIIIIIVIISQQYTSNTINKILVAVVNMKNVGVENMTKNIAAND